jgi:hypothetical protein
MGRRAEWGRSAHADRAGSRLHSTVIAAQTTVIAVHSTTLRPGCGADPSAAVVGRRCRRAAGDVAASSAKDLPGRVLRWYEPVINTRMKRVIGLVVLCGVLAACASPAINEAGYRGKVGHSAASMASIVASAQLAADLGLRGRTIATVTDTIVSQDEQEAQSVLTALDSRQPPDTASIALKKKADEPMQNAANELTDLRIAVRRSDADAERRALADLSKTLAQLKNLQAAS